MCKRSKKNTGPAIFTYGERQRLKRTQQWGEFSDRLNGESFKLFEQCNLCLGKVKNPVICLKGHIFCKECIIENLLYQKKNNNKLMKEYESESNKLKNENLNDIIETEKKINLLKQYENGENNDINVNNKNENNLIIQEQFIKSDLKKCFWLPECIPETREEKKLKPKNILLCPNSNKLHPIKLKDLIDIKLTESKNNNEKFICPICEKELNYQKIICFKNCGHVICESCLNLICKKDEKCNICNTKYSKDNIIYLKESGTPFSIHNNVLIKTYIPFYKY